MNRVGLGLWDSFLHEPWLVFTLLASAARAGMTQTFVAAKWRRNAAAWRALYERWGGAR